MVVDVDVVDVGGCRWVLVSKKIMSRENVPEDWWPASVGWGKKRRRSGG
jgi:hypothetical protein